MGHSEDLEKIIENKTMESKIDLDKVALKRREIIKAELKAAQKESKDEYFTKINIDEANNDISIMLNELAKRFGGEPFSDEAINIAKEFYFENNKALDGDENYDPVRPEDEKEFFIEQMMRYPDVFRQYIFKNDKQEDQPTIKSQL